MRKPETKEIITSLFNILLYFFNILIFKFRKAGFIGVGRLTSDLWRIVVSVARYFFGQSGILKNSLGESTEEWAKAGYKRKSKQLEVFYTYPFI